MVTNGKWTIEYIISWFAGLCGYYNWDKTDDIRLRNGTVLNYPSIVQEGNRGQPKAFIDHWLVELYGNNSIVYGVPKAANLYEPERFCSCERDMMEDASNQCAYGADINNCDVQGGMTQNLIQWLSLLWTLAELLYVDVVVGTEVTEWLVSRAVKPVLPVVRKKRQADNNNFNILVADPPIKIDKKFVPPVSLSFWYIDMRYNVTFFDPIDILLQLISFLLLISLH